MQSITIQGREFKAPTPFTEGHVLSAIEATELNRVYAENLRNNFAARMKKAAEKDQILQQSDFDAYAEEYSFGSRVRRAHIDPVEREERKLTEAAVKKALQRKGFKLKDIPEDTINMHVNNVLATHRYHAQAVENVERRKAAGELDLEI